VITKKIIARKDVSLPPKPKTTEAKKPIVTKQMPAPKAKIALTETPAPKAEPAVKPALKPKVVIPAKQPPKPKVAIAAKQPSKPKAKTSADTTKVKPDVQDKQVVASLVPAVQKFTLPKTTVVYYNPEGKLDPFAPLFQDKQEAPIAPQKQKTKRRTPLTPLEKVDLSQLEVVGIIRALTGNRAIVSEASGKGYVVKKGTPIGNRSGQIVEVLADRIIVEEQVEDIYGKVSVKKRSLQIQKPLGE